MILGPSISRTRSGTRTPGWDDEEGDSELVDAFNDDVLPFGIRDDGPADEPCLKKSPMPTPDLTAVWVGRALLLLIPLAKKRLVCPVTPDVEGERLKGDEAGASTRSLPGRTGVSAT